VDGWSGIYVSNSLHQRERRQTASPTGEAACNQLQEGNGTRLRSPPNIKLSQLAYKNMSPQKQQQPL
jgi:hypothetical protein